ncbi:glycosyltransferase family 9 protein, partial [Patescibacteria group bacterium]|nr:glycosyltransferase family 9 protein [Patescibacteria group bacterium]
KHLRETDISLLKTIGIKVNYPFPLPFLNFSQEEKFASLFLTSNNLENKILIGLHPSTINHQIFKRWPKENFIELGKKILYDFPEVFILLFVDPNEKELCSEMKSKLGNNTVIINNTSLKQVAALIDKCKIFIASDCGLSHIAATTGTNLIAIFGPTNPQIEGPIGEKVHIIKEKCDFPYRRHHRDGNRQEPCKCLTKITPDRVFNKVKEILFK